jgi:hypothetical protein
VRYEFLWPEIKGYLIIDASDLDRLKSDRCLVFPGMNLSDQIRFTVIMCTQALV